MTEAVHKLSQEVNHAVNENLAGVQDYVNITLQVSSRFLWINFWSFSVSPRPQVQCLVVQTLTVKLTRLVMLTLRNWLYDSYGYANLPVKNRGVFTLGLCTSNLSCLLKLWLSGSFVVAFQKEYYKCGYDCFSKDKNDIQRCVQRCSVPVERAGAILQNELNRFQASIRISWTFQTILWSFSHQWRWKTA